MQMLKFGAKMEKISGVWLVSLKALDVEEVDDCFGH
jgi:hypothetical protein